VNSPAPAASPRKRPIVDCLGQRPPIIIGAFVRRDKQGERSIRRGGGMPNCSTGEVHKYCAECKLFSILYHGNTTSIPAMMRLSPNCSNSSKTTALIARGPQCPPSRRGIAYDRSPILFSLHRYSPKRQCITPCRPQRPLGFRESKKSEKSEHYPRKSIRSIRCST
jgi:hypothetical protein